MVAKALAMSGTVTPDSFASCRSLARLNWIIDTTTQPDALTSARIGAVSATVKRRRPGIASYLLDDFSAHSRFHLSATAQALFFLGRTGIVSA